MTAAILLTDRPFGSDDIEREALARAGLSLLRSPAPDAETLLGLAHDIAGMLVCYARVEQELIDAAASGGCRVIARYGIGYDNIDVAAATRANILVTYVPDYCIGEVADHAVALLLSIGRGVARAALEVRDGGWTVPGSGVRRLQGRRLALIGVGRIGRQVALRAAAFGIEVIAYDPHVTVWNHAIARASSLEEALSEADFVSMHAPLTPETHHLIGDEEIDLMAPGAVLVNTSRGGLVDLDAVLRGLDDGRLGGVGLDVVETEPLPSDHPLRTHPLAVVTPHMAFYSAEALAELQRRTVDSVVDALSGRQPRNPVNPEVLAPSS
ncbi:MAG TPA: C-terminal binding protein [Solirubrobacteraceae bacterium]